MLQFHEHSVDFQETGIVRVIELSHDFIRFLETLVCKILHGRHFKNCKIQVLGLWLHASDC